MVFHLVLVASHFPHNISVYLPIAGEPSFETVLVLNWSAWTKAGSSLGVLILVWVIWTLCVLIGRK